MNDTFTSTMADAIISAHCDMLDVRNALSGRIKNRPKDNEGTECTIGMCIDDTIETLESLVAIIEGDEEGEQ